jgi:protein required for attachment to host cells
MHARVVVADQSEARFYDLNTLGGGMRLAGRLTDPLAHLHDRDLVSDKPGRVFDHAPPQAGRRGAVGHHGTGGERSPRKHEAHTFAQRIVAELERARGAGEFERLVLVAGPEFLGMLREVLPKTLETIIAAQINKSLVHQSDAVIKEHLPWDELSFPSSTA